MGVGAAAVLARPAAPDERGGLHRRSTSHGLETSARAKLCAARVRGRARGTN